MWLLRLLLLFSARIGNPLLLWDQASSLSSCTSSHLLLWLAAAPLSSASVSRVVDDAALGGNCV